MTNGSWRTADSAITSVAATRLGSRMMGAAILALLIFAPASLGALPRSSSPLRHGRRPVLLHRIEPHYPADLRARRIEGRVMVDFVVEPDGTVASVHALPAAQPEFAAAAVAAVRQWTFRPRYKRGKAVATRMRVPVVFRLFASTQRPVVHIVVHRPQRFALVGMGAPARGVTLRLVATGSGAVEVRSGRFLVTRAVDDTGATLSEYGTPAFYHPAVGRLTGYQSEITSRQPITVSLIGISAKAKSIRLLEGRLELFVPGLDPDATVSVDNLATKYGRPIRDPALKKAGVTLVVYDRPTAERMYAHHTPGGPQDYDSSMMFGSDYFPPGTSPAMQRAMRMARKQRYAGYGPALAARFKRALQMGKEEIAVGLHDPHHRVVGLEFQAADGSTLHYNHNGQLHSERTAEGKRFDVYDLRAGIPAQIRMVCWLLTKKSVLTMPVKLTNISLPKPGPRAALKISSRPKISGSGHDVGHS